MPYRPLAFLIAGLAATAAIACGSGSSSSPSATLLQCSLDLSAEPPLTIISGGFEVDYLADRFSLATGDFNADGFTDVLIGAPLADGPEDERLNSGEAYIVFGGDSLLPTIDTDEYGGFVVYGGGQQENLGLSVAAGDVNGDGIDDALIGARFASPDGRQNAGETYVVFGRAGLSGTVDVAAGETDVVIRGVDAGDFIAKAINFVGRFGA